MAPPDKDEPEQAGGEAAQEVEEGMWIRVDLCNFCTCLHGRSQGHMRLDDVENAQQI